MMQRWRMCCLMIVPYGVLFILSTPSSLVNVAPAGFGVEHPGALKLCLPGTQLAAATKKGDSGRFESHAPVGVKGNRRVVCDAG